MGLGDLGEIRMLGFKSVAHLFDKVRTQIWNSDQKGFPNGRRARIGLTGSFGRGNYGDELYVKNYQYWFGEWSDLFLLPRLPRPNYFSDLKKGSIDRVDAVVLGGGDLLCPYREKIDKDFVKDVFLKKPLYVAAIGVERNRADVNAETLARWKAFLTHPNVRSISARDQGSADWIAEHIMPAVPVSSQPDMVCALPLPRASAPDGAPIVGLVTRHIKHPKEYVLMAEVASILQDRGWRVRHVIGGVGPHGKKDKENSRHIGIAGKEIVHSENLDDISIALGECSLILSMKLHTTLVGVMYGVPTVSLNPVVKTREFMRQAGCEDAVFAHNDRRLISAVEAGIPPPDPERVEALRNEASRSMVMLGERIWNDLRHASPENTDHMGEFPMTQSISARPQR